MARQKHWTRLGAKLAAMLMAAAAIAVVLGLAVSVLGTFLVRAVYCSTEQQELRIKRAIASFREYVALENVASTDLRSISLWNGNNPHVRLAISANGIWIRSDRSGAELLKTDSGLLFRDDSREVSGGTFAVNFADGAYQVQLMESSEVMYYGLVTITSFAAAGMVFLALMLWYNRKVTRSVTRLAARVRQVSQGDLTMEICPTSNDEIGNLARDVNHMRLSILDKLNREAAAWRANSELITAMSHDVRTPLTTLMGYLELLSQENLDPQKREAYVELCCRKAEKLRELTNELFSYSMVFGKEGPEVRQEIYDAQLLLEQLLGEHEAELLEAGYQVNAHRLAEPGQIRVDLQHLRRVLDNLFSNIRKYADPKMPVVIETCWEGPLLRITLQNGLPHKASLVESTRIGLRTCEKLMAAMGGSFQREQTPDAFIVHIRIPGQHP